MLSRIRLSVYLTAALFPAIYSLPATKWSAHADEDRFRALTELLKDMKEKQSIAPSYEEYRQVVADSQGLTRPEQAELYKYFQSLQEPIISREDLAALFEAKRSSIKDIRMEYATKSPLGGPDGPPFFKSVTFAASGGNLYINSHSDRVLDYNEQNNTYWYDGSVQRGIERQGADQRGRGEVREFTDPNTFHDTSSPLAMAGLLPSSGIRESSIRHLPEYLKGPAMTILSKKEKIGDTECIVAVGGAYNIYLDPSRDFSVVGVKSAFSDGVKYEFVYEGLVDCGNGVWLPTRVTTKRYDETGWKETHSTEMKKVEINKGVPEELFKADFPKGMSVYDYILNIEYPVNPEQPSVELSDDVALIENTKIDEIDTKAAVDPIQKIENTEPAVSETTQKDQPTGNLWALPVLICNCCIVLIAVFLTIRLIGNTPDAFCIWGSALSDQANLKGNTPEGDLLFTKAGKKYAEAVRIKPDMHEAFYNWGNALSNQARLKGNTPEGDRLFAQAGEKYSQAVRIKADKYQAFYNWGNALSNQARLKGNTPEGDRLFAQAGEKYSQAASIKPDLHQAFYNWGNALSERARLKRNATDEERFRLFGEAGEKCAEAVRIKPDMHEAFNNWGNALFDQANLKGNTPEGNLLFTEAGKKYAEAVRIKPDMHEAFYNWGNALSDQAKLKGNTPEGDLLFTEAGKKYAEAVRIKPDDHDAFYDWGNVLSDQAKFKGNTPEGDRLFARAREKYAEAVRIKPDMYEAFNNWGNALLEQAKFKGNTPEGERLFAEAGEKYSEAVRIKPDYDDAHFNLGCLCALQGDATKAVGHLESWRKYCPTASQADIDKDTDLDPIRDTEEFRKFRDTLPPGTGK